MSTSNSIRGLMQPVSDGVRAYFAPVARSAVTAMPTAFDAATAAAFDLEQPPAPWMDAGWVDKFTRTPTTKVSSVRLGTAATVGRQFRSQSGATVELAFREWGKLQMALAGGGVHRNVLASAALALQPGSTAQELKLGAAAASFAPGDLISVDLDYAGETGYLGGAMIAAFVSSSQASGLGADYLRSVSFNLGRVSAVTNDSLQLERSLPAGVPPAAAKLQKVTAFLDREGGSFFQQWSALFVMPALSGGTIFFYYPRLSSAGSPREGFTDLEAPLRTTTLAARFDALASADSDGALIYCQRIYVPPAGAAVY